MDNREVELYMLDSQNLLTVVLCDPVNVHKGLHFGNPFLIRHPTQITQGPVCLLSYIPLESLEIFSCILWPDFFSALTLASPCLPSVLSV